MPDTFQFTSVTSYDDNGTPLLSGFLSTNREVNGVTSKYSMNIGSLSKKSIGEIALRASKYANGSAITVALEEKGYYLDNATWRERVRNALGDCSAAPSSVGDTNQSACEAIIEAKALDDRLNFKQVVSVNLVATVTRNDIHAYHVGYTVNVVNRVGESGVLSTQSWLNGVTEFAVTPEKAYEALTPAILLDFDAWSGYANDPATSTVFTGIPEFDATVIVVEEAVTRTEITNTLPESVVKTSEDTPPDVLLDDLTLQRRIRNGAGFAANSYVARARTYLDNY